MKYDPQIHQRRSIRLKGYDYAQAGAYFVTMVTRERECLFGEIVNASSDGGDMVLNDLGKIADECWRAIPEHFPCVELGAYVVMPNHVHGIIVIIDDDGTVGARHASPLQKQKPAGGTRPNSLGAIVGSFKSSVTRSIGHPNVWQRNYYEHIIRNEREMGNIWRYIEANPTRWREDDENLAHPR